MKDTGLVKCYLTITSTNAPATDLGYLLHKDPSRLQSFPLSFGQAHVFYPEATPERCTAALLDVNPVALVRNRRGSSGEGTLDQYVNDRHYVATSFLSVAIARPVGKRAGRQEQGPAGIDGRSHAVGSQDFGPSVSRRHCQIHHRSAQEDFQNGYIGYEDRIPVDLI